MWREVIHLWQSIRDPEYAHLILESLPLYGLAFGMVFLAAATLAGEVKVRLLALALMGLSCASVWPYLSFRQAATPRILATRPVAQGPEIEKQTRLRQEVAWAYYAMAGACLLAMGMLRSRHGRRVLSFVFILGAGLFWLSVWLHQKECEVYHPNIRRLVRPG